MKIEIWSDIMCPFCYIGKKKFETALEQFPHKDQIEVEWKSFQLMPELETAAATSLEDILVTRKGLSREQVRSMNQQITLTAKQVGIEFNLDRSQPANTLKAHRFLHYAKTVDKQTPAEESLFKAYFTEGKNVDDNDELVSIGSELGMNPEALKEVLNSERYTREVEADIQDAAQIGVRGVPFFVFDRKAAVSGAQDPQTFTQALQQTFAAWEQENKAAKLQIISDGSACDMDGSCN